MLSFVLDHKKLLFGISVAGRVDGKECKDKSMALRKIQCVYRIYHANLLTTSRLFRVDGKSMTLCKNLGQGSYMLAKMKIFLE